MNDSTLHEAIIASFLARQRPPAIRELAARFGCEEVAARRGNAPHHDHASRPVRR